MEKDIDSALKGKLKRAYKRAAARDRKLDRIKAREANRYEMTEEDRERERDRDLASWREIAMAKGIELVGDGDVYGVA